ncbi:hypothetical protein [Streptomyces coffeae]|uniref:Uncharacterized protein n=1 Tax=Streptomyces coffeae TaxID=621382 RepID=A0ABS1NR80_9ACTN|nr:hypothetical protein [Streptomyces coffeae]MBL1102450.1 hypothetical protein [Streptomyces coffeae]
MRLTVYTIEGLEARMQELRALANRSRANHRPTSRAGRRAVVVAARAALARKRWTR